MRVLARDSYFWSFEPRQ